MRHILGGANGRVGTGEVSVSFWCSTHVSSLKVFRTLKFGDIARLGMSRTFRAHRIDECYTYIRFLWPGRAVSMQACAENYRNDSCRSLTAPNVRENCSTCHCNEPRSNDAWPHGRRCATKRDIRGLAAGVSRVKRVRHPAHRTLALVCLLTACVTSAADSSSREWQLS